jgi:hypothetical protein
MARSHTRRRTRKTKWLGLVIEYEGKREFLTARYPKPLPVPPRTTARLLEADPNTGKTVEDA